ncbi:MAG: molybdopterin converting factor subunit 1 [Planctomycetes bacterium]|nr:molybdopterin converting factor subunit 1 [Planctomycetota bacterium]
MKIKLLCFAHIAERIGARELEVEAPDGCTATVLMQQLDADFPKLQGALSTCRVAVDEEFTKPEVTLSDGQTVVFIPPVSGG